MIASLVSWVALSFKLKKVVAKRIVIGVLVLAVASACVVTKKCYDNRLISNYEQEKQIELLKDKVIADENASEQRAEDTIRDNAAATKRKEAIDEAPDEPLTKSASNLGCDRLREQGYDTSNYTECN